MTTPRHLRTAPVEIDLPESGDQGEADGAPETDATKTEPAPCEEHPLAARVEALLMSTDRPLTEGQPRESQTEGGRRFTSQPDQRPTGRYETQPAPTSNTHTSRRFNQVAQSPGSSDLRGG